MRVKALALPFFFGLALVWGLFGMVPSAAEAQTNLLSNSNFSTNLNGWTCLKSNYATGAIPNDCEWFSDSSVGAGQSKGDSRLRQIIYLEPGIYSIEARARAVTQGRSDTLCAIKSSVFLEAGANGTVSLNFETQNYTYHVKSGSIEITEAVTAVVTFKGTNTAVCGNRSNVDYIYLGFVPETSPPPVTNLPPLTITATCVITTTEVVISGTETVTNTEVATVSANILVNSSFDTLVSGLPTSWSVYPPSSYESIASLENPRSGSYGLHFEVNKEETTLQQEIIVPPETPPTVTWTYGGYLQEGSYGVSAGSLGEIRLSGNTFPAVSLIHAEPITYYAPLSRTAPVGNFTSFEVRMPRLNSGSFATEFWLDDVFLIPTVDIGGSPYVHCPTVANYEPPGGGGGGEGSPVEGAGGIPVPIGGAGEVCWECRWPAGRGVEMAIAWLGCVIRNLFSCSLRIWLLGIVNAVVGVFGVLVGYVAWVPSQAQAAINWVAVVLMNGTDWLNLAISAIQPGTAVVSSGMGIWDVLYALMRLIPDSISALTGFLSVLLDGAFMVISLIVLALFSVLELFFTLVMVIFQAIPAIWQGINMEPMTLFDFLDANGWSVNSDAMTSFVWGVGVVDEWIVVYSIHWVFWILAGGIFINVILWLKEEFSRPWF